MTNNISQKQQNPTITKHSYKNTFFPSPKTTMKICHYNINSARKYKHELLTTFTDVDIFALNETRFTSPTTQFSLPGYSIYRQDRLKKSGGGVLLAFRNTLQSNHVFSGIIEHNEIVVVEIKMKSEERLLVTSIYCPPDRTISKKALDKIINLHPRHLILGDLNAKHVELGCRTTNTSGRILDEWIIENQIEIIGGKTPTFEKGNYNEKLDWVLSDTQTAIMTNNYKVHPQLGETSSGHYPLTLELTINTDEREMESARKQFVFTKANWKQYKTELNQRLKQRPVKEVDTIDDLIDYNSFITQCINEATENSIPTPERFKREQQIKPSTVTLRLIKQKHQIYRQLMKDKRNSQVKAEFYRIRRLVKNSLSNDSTTSFKNLLNALTAPKMNSKQVWSTVNRFHGKKISREIKDALKLKNKIARFDNEKVELFREYFEEIYTVQRHDSKEQTETENAVEILIEESRPNTNHKFPRITKKELKSVLDNLGNTAVGHDGVHNKCLKKYTKLFISHLLALYNSSFNVSYIPPAWKMAHIILIHKEGKDPKDPSSYRPISLLSCIGKVIERIVKCRLTAHVEQNKLLPEYQAGFRSKRSTTDNLLQLKHNIELSLNRNRHVALITFDIKGAFDAVWHQGLLWKLNEMKVPKYLWCWIHDFLTQREAKIEYKASTSSGFILQRGTPQGSPLSPLLYIIFTADSLISIPTHTHANLFADDTSIWSDSNTITNLRSRLQDSVNRFVGWCKRWKLQVQPTKTKLVHFSNHPRRKLKTPLTITIDGQIVPLANEAKYLGVTFDRTLKFQTHLREIKKNTSFRIGLLRYLARNTGEEATKTLQKIQKSLVQSITTYATTIFLNNKNYWKIAQVIQNQSMKAILRLPQYTPTKYIHQQLHEPMLFDTCSQATIRYINKAIQNGNSRILNILQETIKMKSTANLPLSPLLPMLTAF